MSISIDLVDVRMTLHGPPPVEALRGATCTITAGSWVTFTGPSGAGKSTLLQLLGLLTVPTSGAISLDESDPATMSETQRTEFRRVNCGFVFQSFHLIPHLTVIENIALVLDLQQIPYRDRAQGAARALARVGMSDRAEAFPRHLSGGERQRAALARALVGKPRLLLCDEPTGNLDSENRDIVLGILDLAHRDGTTVVVVSHDPVVAARGQVEYRMSDGRVAEPQ